MNDLETVKALEKLFERKDRAEEKTRAEKERQFIADATKAYLGPSEKTGIQVYHPENMIEFLSMPTAELKKKLGGEWANMEDLAFEAFAYTVKQKIQKSVSIMDWDE